MARRLIAEASAIGLGSSPASATHWLCGLGHSSYTGHLRFPQAQANEDNSALLRVLR